MNRTIGCVRFDIINNNIYPAFKSLYYHRQASEILHVKNIKSYTICKLRCCKKIKQPGQAGAIPSGVASDRSEERNEDYGMSPLNLKDSDVINEGPGWSSSAMESKNIITSPNNIEGKVFIVRVSRIYGGDNVTVPQDVYESRGFEIRAAESAGLEECDSITLTSYCLERFYRRQGSRQGVSSNSRAEEANCIAGMGVRTEEEDGCVEESSV